MGHRVHPLALSHALPFPEPAWVYLAGIRGLTDFRISREGLISRVSPHEGDGMRGMGSGTGLETDHGALPAVGPEPQSASRLATRLELLRNMLRPTPHVPLAMNGMKLFAKLEYVNPVGSIKDRAAYWILKRAAES